MKNVINLIGSNENLPVKINITENLKNEIRQFATSDLTRELGGVLIGTFNEENNNYILNVENFIIAKHTDAHLSSVTFTAETWAQINSEIDEKYPNYKILGWYHTHPGFGIFLSNWDIFIQENFFNIPWQIAYVIDPCHKTDGFFIWKDNNICKISEDNFDLNIIEENHIEENITDITETSIDDTEVINKKTSFVEKILNNKFYKLLSNKSKLISIILIFILIFLMIFVSKDYVINNIKHLKTFKNTITKDYLQ